MSAQVPHLNLLKNAFYGNNDDDRTVQNFLEEYSPVNGKQATIKTCFDYISHQ